MNILTNKYLLWFTRLFLGFIFIYAGMQKISEPAAFADSIANYKLIPEFLINFFAVIIPWIEVSAALLLIFGVSLKESAAIINILLVIFILMILISVFRGLDINCGCFGTTNGQKVGLLKILENLGLLAIGFYIFFFSNRKITFSESADLQ